jgi:hypothetical protein
LKEEKLKKEKEEVKKCPQSDSVTKLICYIPGGKEGQRRKTQEREGGNRA